MSLHLLRLPKLVAERRAPAVFGLAIIVLVWSGVLLKFSDDWRAAYLDAERANNNFAMVFEENVLRSLGELDKAVLYLRRSIESRKDNVDFNTIVSTTDVLSEIIVQVAIIDANGIMRASNVGPQPAPLLDLSDREHYRAHLGTDKDELYISKPMVGRVSKQWSVQVTRRFLNRDGSFGGVVVASLNPDHFTNFYNRINLDAGVSIALVGQDGVVRSSGGNGTTMDRGQDLAGTSLMDFIQAGKEAAFEAPGPDGSGMRLVTARPVRDHPLWVVVSRDKADVLHGTWTNLALNTLLGLLFIIVVLIAMERMLRTETVAKETEANAKLKASQLQLTLENMNQGIMLVTSDLRVPIINSKCEELLGLPPSFISQPPRFEEPRYQDICASVSESDLSGLEVALAERVTKDGKVIEVRTGKLPDGSFVQTFTDITERREAEARVVRLASEDSLTGLPNRRAFRAKLEEICERRRATTSQDRFAILFLDLDRFKTINDTLGHRIGDVLLQQVGNRLSKLLPAEAMLARLGGDEFAIVVEAVHSTNDVEALAASIVETVATPYEVDGYQIRSGMSIGIAMRPSDGDTVESLLVAADLALYAVKEQGRGTYRFHSRLMNIELNARREMEMGLRVALERNQFELHYQPILNVRTNKIAGFEALVRWRHPEKGLIPPGVFISVVEDSGLMVPIGKWVLAEAARTAAQWPKDIKVAVNISPAQLLDPNFADMVEECLSEAGLVPSRLEIEITERMIMQDADPVWRVLHRLRDMGVRIALDDFGTGYSSLSYLRKFPFDKIKIDRTFVSDLTAGAEQAAIVQAVVSIARALKMATTAEGVELASQYDFLAALGCDEAQGYLISKPLPASQVARFLASTARSGLKAA
jgi:diguanylate cyclase (GGDEF)-like protein